MSHKCLETVMESGILCYSLFIHLKLATDYPPPSMHCATKIIIFHKAYFQHLLRYVKSRLGYIWTIFACTKLRKDNKPGVGSFKINK